MTTLARHRRAPARKRLRLARRDENIRITSLALPAELHDRARMAAIRLNWSFAEVVRQALEPWLDTLDVLEPLPTKPNKTRRS